MLLAQDRFGARFFIPKRFLPQKYDYHRPRPPPQPLGGGAGGGGGGGRGGGGNVGTVAVLPQDLDLGDGGGCTDNDCVICMAEVEDEDAFMIAPCDHVFHKDCLLQWMQVKMECPTCRAPLPPQ